MGSSTLDKLYGAIRDVPDFPSPGVLFRDITPLLLDAPLFRQALDLMLEPVADLRIDKVMAIESRGFILGAPVAQGRNAGLILARKDGKLPWNTRKAHYVLEYGSDAIEVHTDAVDEGDHVLVVDDVLATGGTAEAASRVVRDAGGELVGVSVLIELCDLNGRDRLGGTPVWSVLSYPAPGA